MSPVASALNERSEFRDEVPRVASALVENRISADENRKAKLCKNLFADGAAIS